ncbi:MAG: hypothetical protein GVY28_00155 [Alphaproteobacteria bacterium]|nr:hypothetical protein [Alphaproteobacteria bacterium]
MFADSLDAASVSDVMPAPELALPAEICRQALTAMAKAGLPVGPLDALKDPARRVGLGAGAEALASVLDGPVAASLDDPDTGILGIDIPKGIAEAGTPDALAGALVAMAVTRRAMTPTLDVRNRTPFTLYNASAGNEAALKQAGVKFYSPDEKLGFHTDGRLEGEAVFVPARLMIYNILIAYRRPGLFHWMPFRRWTRFEEFGERFGWNRRYRFAMTPIVYAGADGAADVASTRTLEAPLFWRLDDGRRGIFMNGDVLGPADGEAMDPDLVEEMQESIRTNPVRLSLPQKARRLLLMTNTAGLHARDIFEEPVGGTRYTRSFIRSVAMEGPQVG